MGAFFYRVMGAAMLDAGVYEGIEADRRATWPAFAVVMIASLAAGFGASGFEHPDSRRIVLAAIIALLAWIGWAVLILRIGGRHLPESRTRVTLGQLVRTIGFAASPGWLQVFAMFPSITIPVYVISWTWMLAAMVVAVKHALDYRSMGRAIMICVVSLALISTFAAILSILFGPAAA
jgi:hypothetical protein